MIAAVTAWHRATSASSVWRWRTKAVARVKSIAGAMPICCRPLGSTGRTRLPRRYHVERETPMASHGRCAGRRGMMPCARRQRSARRRARSRRSAAVIGCASRARTLLRALPISTRIQACEHRPGRLIVRRLSEAQSAPSAKEAPLMATKVRPI
jgi:hypothetical protein